MKMDYKRKWIENHFEVKKNRSSLVDCFWVKKDKTPLYDCIWRNLIPFDIINQIDLQKIKEAKQEFMNYNENYSDDIRILKKVFFNRKQYDVIIDIRDPRYDWQGNSYQIFIRFARPVNNIPLTDEHRCVKLVIRCKDGVDEILYENVTTIMCYEPNRGEEYNGRLCDIIASDFDNTTFDRLVPYSSKTLRDILFKYLVFIKICDIDKNSQSFKILDNKNYSICCVINNTEFLTCAFTKSEAQQIADNLRKSSDYKKDNTYNVVYLKDDFSKNVLSKKNINTISIEDFCEQYYKRDCYKEQIKFLRSMPAVDYKNEFDNDKNYQDKMWDFIFIPKTEETYRRVKIQDFLDVKTKDYVKRKKKTYMLANDYKKIQEFKKEDTRSYEKRNVIIWQNDKYFITNEDSELLKVKGTPEPKGDDYWLCYFDKVEFEKQDKIKISDNKKTIIVPENGNTACFISEQMYGDAVNVIEAGISDENLYDVKIWFRFLCAVNLVNAYKKYTKNKIVDVSEYNNKLHQLITDFLKNNGNTMEVKRSEQQELLISIMINDKKFQFLYPPMPQGNIKLVFGEWDGIQLQPIASMLYEYSIWILTEK